MAVTVNANYSEYLYKAKSDVQDSTLNKPLIADGAEKTQGFAKILLEKSSKEKPTSPDRLFSQEGLFYYSDDPIKNSQSRNLPTEELVEQSRVETENKPLWHWHDGQFGYSAEVFKNEGTESEYTVKLKYDDGKEEERIVDAESISGSNCNIVDLSVKMYHLEAEGKVENPAPQLLIAHLYMKYRTPDANENTCINYRSWFEQQLELEMKTGKNEKHIKNLLELLQYL